MPLSCTLTTICVNEPGDMVAGATSGCSSCGASASSGGGPSGVDAPFGVAGVPRLAARRSLMPSPPASAAAACAPEPRPWKVAASTAPRINDRTTAARCRRFRGAPLVLLGAAARGIPVETALDGPDAVGFHHDLQFAGFGAYIGGEGSNEAPGRARQHVAAGDLFLVTGF